MDTQKIDQPLRILLLEDSAADAALIKHALLSAGLRVALTQVATRQAYAAELNLRPFQLILSDFSLPGFDGGQALALARATTPAVPFIFVTGTLGEEVAIAMLRQGATDYVLKNRLSRLVPAITRALSEVAQRTEREAAEEALRVSHAQLRALASHLQFVREEERTRISRQVHDELGQDLTGLKLDLAWLSGRLQGARAAQTKIKAMAGRIDTTILNVRRIATDLRPAVLDSLGLVAAIEWQGAEFAERTGIPCDMRIAVPEAIWNSDFNTACFRIFQEAMTNIIRHADATRVEVSLGLELDQLVLTVHDNGRGITAAEIVHAHSIGLIGMRERAADIGGIIQFAGDPATGSTVTMRMPLPVPAATAA